MPVLVNSHRGKSYLTTLVHIKYVFDIELLITKTQKIEYLEVKKWTAYTSI